MNPSLGDVMTYPLDNTKNAGGAVIPITSICQAKSLRWRDLIEKRLQVCVPAPEEKAQLVRGAMRHATEDGHRWRPLLLLSAYEACAAKDGAEAVDAACAIELIHCCTIILDDLPCIDDNAGLRRGRTPCHIVYGEAVTIYASHLLYALAERLACENAARLRVDEMVIWRHLGQLRERLVGVQELELNLSQREYPPTDAVLDRFYELKSAPFISAAWLAATLGKVKEQERINLCKFAELLGKAYQLADDILDAEGEPAKMGKPAGKDRGKINYVTRDGIFRAKELMLMHLASADRMLAAIAGDTDSLRSLLYQIVTPLLPR